MSEAILICPLVPSLTACGWAGAVFELLKHLGKSSEAKDRKKLKKVKWGLTDRPTDRRTKLVLESRSTRLRSEKKKEAESKSNNNDSIFVNM